MRRASVVVVALCFAGCGDEAREPAATPAPTGTVTVEASDAPAREAGLMVSVEGGDSVPAGVGSTCLSTVDETGKASGSCIDKVYPLERLKPLRVKAGETLRLEYAQRVSDAGDDVATASLGSGRSVTRDLRVELVDTASRKVWQVELPSRLAPEERYLWTSIAVDDGATTGQASFQARLDVAG